MSITTNGLFYATRKIFGAVEFIFFKTLKMNNTIRCSEKLGKGTISTIVSKFILKTATESKVSDLL
jgi:hypothetical protein